MAPPRRQNNKRQDIPRAAATKAQNVGKEEEKPCAEAPTCCLDEAILTCDICLELMHNVMNVAPCNHKFCAACIYEWLDRNNTCPKCRWKHSNVTRDALVNQMIETYVDKNPSRRRTEAQLAEQDELELKHLRKKQANREAEESDMEDEEDSMEVDVEVINNPIIRDINERLFNALDGMRNQIEFAPRLLRAAGMGADEDFDDDDTASLAGNRDREYRFAEEDARIERLQRQKEEREARIRAQSRPANRGSRCANRRGTPVPARRSAEAAAPRQYNLRARRNVNA